ncbi:hypothetical protein NDA01_07100 [Trichocoleus desertorum AS-A10]|uniref:hypothetical protein n=1 Tax=Trichocoleus desertorum TaxID=1481672 RepID=UPI00329971D2
MSASPSSVQRFVLLVEIGKIAELKGDRADINQEIETRRSNAAVCHSLLVTAEALWVWVERTTTRPHPISEALLQGFQVQVRSPK